MNYFVTAIGTDSGKTVISAILVSYLSCDYWKPVQCGEPRDTDAVRDLTGAEPSRFFNERHFLKMPASPHAAAKAEGVEIRLDDFHPPVSNRDLVIEGAGGMLVPLNQEDYVIDLTKQFDLKVILVCNLYLGSINHSLLSIEELKRRNVPVLGIVFNGPANEESERIILAKSPWPCLLRVAQHDQATPEVVQQYAAELASQWGPGFAHFQDDSIFGR